ncbi:MAG TPA: hypothetical protein ENI82_01160 [Bacteroidetes bacterium]|nr:hypothetical protein [Bacteroidota bacterium]
MRYIIYALDFVLAFRKVEKDKAKKIKQYTLVGLLLWLGILAILNIEGYYQNEALVGFRVLMVFIPPFLLISYLMLSKRFAKNVLSLLPGKWLIHIQSFRIVMELIFWLGYIGGFVPFQMTFEGFNFDIMVGITAFIAGSVFFVKGRFRKFEVFIWNIFGLALLLNIFVIGFLSVPSSFRVFMNEPANKMLGNFPFIWIPGFIVPFAFAMHVFSIKQIFIISKRKFRFKLKRKFKNND